MDNTMMSFETDTVKSQTNFATKNEEKHYDIHAMMPQNSIDNHSFQNYDPNNFFIEPMGENSVNKTSVKHEMFDETDDTDYEYMG